VRLKENLLYRVVVLIVEVVLGNCDLAEQSKLMELLQHEGENEEKYTIRSNMNNLLNVVEGLQYACHSNFLFFRKKAYISSRLLPHNHLYVRWMMIEELQAHKGYHHIQACHYQRGYQLFMKLISKDRLTRSTESSFGKTPY